MKRPNNARTVVNVGAAIDEGDRLEPWYQGRRSAKRMLILCLYRELSEVLGLAANLARLGDASESATKIRPLAFHATNRDEALRLLQDHASRIAMLFTDVMMASETDGLELARIVTPMFREGCSVTLAARPKGASLRPSSDDQVKS